MKKYFTQLKWRTVAGVAVLLFLAAYGAHTIGEYERSGTAQDSENESAVHSESAAGVVLPATPSKVEYQVSSSTPQFVLLSFDGSKSVAMLNDTLAFEHQMQAEGKYVRFTYFINAAYFLSSESANAYQPPSAPRGISNIGFSNRPGDIAARVHGFNTAYAEGNEIGSHTVGHFVGSRWSYDEWAQEFASFNSVMANVQTNNPTQVIEAPAFLSDIRGFRAPALGVDDALYRALKDFHFTYDASTVGEPDAWPHKDQYGLWRIPLGTVFIGARKSPLIAMDYNWWVHQSGAKEQAVPGTPLWDSYLNEVTAAYAEYFKANYNGTRAPVVISGHFSLWNGGVYWAAMKAFAENVCGQPQVRCVTFKDLVDYLNANGTPPVKNKAR